MYDHQTKTSGRGRGKGDFRRREKKSGIQYYCQSGEYKRSEYLHLFQGKRCTENLYCKCKKNKTGKYRTVSADETAVSEEQAEESGIYKEKQSTYQKLDKINKIVAHFAAGIGLLGCKYYFIIPCLLILHKYYMEVLFEGDLNKKTEAQKQQEIIWLLNNNFGKHIIVKLLNVSYEEVEILNLMYCKKKKYL